MLRFILTMFSSIGFLLFTGCAFTVKIPIVYPESSKLQYENTLTDAVRITIIDQRTDTVFHQGIGGLQNVKISIDNLGDPVQFLTQNLEKELNDRKIPVVCKVGKTNENADMVLRILLYKIVSRRINAYTPWESFHQFVGEFEAGGSKHLIKAYFYNGKVPVWSMNEIHEPCINTPISIIIKEIATKMNNSVFKMSVNDQKVTELTSEVMKNLSNNDRNLWFKILELGATNNNSAMKSLKEIIAKTTDSEIRGIALSTMGNLGAQNEFETLKQTTGSLQNFDTFMLMKAIGDIGTDEAIAFLLKQKDTDLYKNEGGMSYCIDLYTTKF